MEILVTTLAVATWGFYAVMVVVVVRLFFILPRLDQFLGRATNSASGTKLAQRLGELEIAQREHLVTPEEYAAKRQEILKDL
ncbi:MAG: hypothetical protein LV479_08460 [Methylacidiphilales bacterium]|nr:hypothetical protein [Candidatus Methylacidiphilales bacterium]